MSENLLDEAVSQRTQSRFGKQLGKLKSTSLTILCRQEDRTIKFS